jgi:hypothetical protein
MTWPDGSQYIGAFKYDKQIGEGTYIQADDGQYIGAFENNKKHGQGTYTYADGSEYVGLFKNDKNTRPRQVYLCGWQHLCWCV